MKHNVCVISGSRAEYGLLKNLLHQLNNSKEINYQLIYIKNIVSIYYIIYVNRAKYYNN